MVLARANTVMHRVRYFATPEALLTLTALALYLASAFLRNRVGIQEDFGADTSLYLRIANGNPDIDRLILVHPVTVLLDLGWMSLVSPLVGHLSAGNLIAPVSAAVGAAGVWAAVDACSRFMPRTQALICGAIYACSLGIWYFSAVPESKIVTATLSTLYIAQYLRLREEWTVARASLTTLIFSIACLNEIVSAFLIAIPAVDRLLKRDFEKPAIALIIGQVLAAFGVFLFFEIVIRGMLVHPATLLKEGRSHFEMFMHYWNLYEHNLSAFYNFFLNWFLFNFAAPASEASDSLAQTPWSYYRGYFVPSIAGYFSSPLGLGVVLAFVAMIAVSFTRRPAGGLGSDTKIIFAALMSYAAVRALFVFLFSPLESLLFASAVTLVHLLIFVVPFNASTIPDHVKTKMLSGVAGVLFLNNLRFMLP